MNEERNPAIEPYRGYRAHAEKSPDGTVWIGHADCSESVLFSAESPADLQRAFEEAMDNFLQICDVFGTPRPTPYAERNPKNPLTGTGGDGNIAAEGKSK
jgi:predicted HicB family RNase H-like nuclease